MSAGAARPDFAVVWAFLDLVDSPLTERVAQAIRDERSFEELARRSDLYMVAARPAAFFENYSWSDELFQLSFDFRIGERVFDRVIINVLDLPGMGDVPKSQIWMSAGDHNIVFFLGPHGNRELSEDVSYLTPERLLWLRSREMEGVNGIADFRDASTYDLLYIGIARTGDSYDRLFRRGHKARLDILASEPARLSGASTADEIVLFMFAADSALLTRADDEIADEAREDFKGKKLIIDAEKAFVHLLNPKYNVIRYKNYPESTDGMYRSGYTMYSYTIRENIILRTPQGSIRGGKVIDSPGSVGDAQSVLVIGDHVRIVDDLLEAMQTGSEPRVS